MIKMVTIEELDKVMEIINDAKDLLKKDSLQWQQGYPNEKVESQDILNHDLYAYYENDIMLGIVSLVVGIEPNYTEIDGKWIHDVTENDLTIHRIAVKAGYHGKKVGQKLMEFSIDFAKKKGIHSIKVDTHKVNMPMQYLAINNGFKYCGIIWLKRDEVDNSRLAYELSL